jgi:hypothetical protein
VHLAPPETYGPGGESKGDPGHGRKGGSTGLWLVVAVAAAGLALYLFIGQSDWRAMFSGLDWWGLLIKPLARILIFIAAGLLVGQLIEGLGLSARIGRLTSPLISRAHLPPEAGAAFAAAFASGVAANTLLYTSWQEGKLSRRQLFLANILNASLPAYFLHLPSTFFVVYALLGKAALVYFGLTLFAAILRCLGVIVISRFVLPSDCCTMNMPAGQSRQWKEIWRDTWRKFIKRFKRLILMILPIYLVVFLLAQAGAFAWMGQALAGIVSSRVLPMEAMSVVVFSVVAEFTSGFAAAAALLEAGSLNMQQVVVALLVGNMVATPVRVLRHQLPHYMGIYSPGLGMKLLALGQAARVISVCLVCLVYVAWWF